MGGTGQTDYDAWLTTDPEDGWEECQACGANADIGPDGVCDRCARESAEEEKADRIRKGEW